MSKISECKKCHLNYDSLNLAVGKKFQCMCGEWNQVRSILVPEPALPQKLCSSCFSSIASELARCSQCHADLNATGNSAGNSAGSPVDSHSPSKHSCPACGEGARLGVIRFNDPEFSIERCASCLAMWVDKTQFAIFLSAAKTRLFSRINSKETAAAGTVEAEAAVTSAVKSSQNLKSKLSGSSETSKNSEDGTNTSHHKVPYYKKCPYCKDLLGRENFGSSSGVIIDACHIHGVWLDAPELGKIFNFVANGAWLEAHKDQLKAIKSRAQVKGQSGSKGPTINIEIATENVEDLVDVISLIMKEIFKDQAGVL